MKLEVNIYPHCTAPKAKSKTSHWNRITFHDLKLLGLAGLDAVLNVVLVFPLYRK